MKSRKTLGLISIILSIVFAVGLIGMQLLNTATQSEVATVSKNITRGEVVSVDKITWVRMPRSVVKENYITRKSSQFKENANVQFAKIDMMNGDILTNQKLSTNATGTDNALLTMSADKQAITFPVNAGSSSMSNKLRVGDVIQIWSVNGNEVHKYQSLQYVQIVSMTTSDYKDISSEDKSNDPTVVYDSLTFILSEKQIEDLISAQGSAVITLVSRGNEEQAKILLQQQENILRNLA